jgi:L-amino acid N-acyltransferase YncA
MSTQPAAANVAIRGCEASDVAAITTIYAHHVLYGLASFELEPPSENDMQQRRLDIVSRGFPYLVAECAGEVVGYAYAPPALPPKALRGVRVARAKKRTGGRRLAPGNPRRERQAKSAEWF